MGRTRLAPLSEGGGSVLRGAKMAGKLFLAALGALLGRSKASKAPTRAPRARQEASRDEKETPGVDLGRRFGSKDDES